MDRPIAPSGVGVMTRLREVAIVGRSLSRAMLPGDLHERLGPLGPVERGIRREQSTHIWPLRWPVSNP